MSTARVLIVEDDDDVRLTVRAAIERAGMEVVEARDGREGLRRFYELAYEAGELDEVPELRFIDEVALLPSPGGAEGAASDRGASTGEEPATP